MKYRLCEECRLGGVPSDGMCVGCTIKALRARLAENDSKYRHHNETIDRLMVVERERDELRAALEKTALHLAAYLEMSDQQDGDIYDGGMRALHEAEALLGEEEA